MRRARHCNPVPDGFAERVLDYRGARTLVWTPREAVGASDVRGFELSASTVPDTRGVWHAAVGEAVYHYDRGAGYYVPSHLLSDFNIFVAPDGAVDAAVHDLRAHGMAAWLAVQPIIERARELGWLP